MEPFLSNQEELRHCYADEAENPGSPNSVSSSSANADTTEDESHLTSVESPQSEEERSSDVADMYVPAVQLVFRWLSRFRALL